MAKTLYTAEAHVTGGRAEGLQFKHVLRKTVGTHGQITTHGTRCILVSTGCAPESEIDAPRKQRRERTKLFGNHER